MIWKGKKQPHTKEVHESAQVAAEQLKVQQPHVNAVALWLERRHSQNGFGEDFEITLRPKGAR